MATPTNRAGSGTAGEPPEPDDRAPGFEALLCDGETFRATTLSDATGDRGVVLVFFGFVGSAIARNWWKRYDRYGWDGFDGVPVLGVSRDGPYAQNAFLRKIESPFRTFADVDADAIRAYDLLGEREGMAGVHTARRAVFVLDEGRTVRYQWLADDWISPVPADEVASAVADLG